MFLQVAISPCQRRGWSVGDPRRQQLTLPGVFDIATLKKTRFAHSPPGGDYVPPWKTRVLFHFHAASKQRIGLERSRRTSGLGAAMKSKAKAGLAVVHSEFVASTPPGGIDARFARLLWLPAKKVAKPKVTDASTPSFIFFSFVFCFAPRDPVAATVIANPFQYRSLFTIFSTSLHIIFESVWASCPQSTCQASEIARDAKSSGKVDCLNGINHRLDFNWIIFKKRVQKLFYSESSEVIF